MTKNKCLNCGDLTKNKKYCSYKCSNSHKWVDPNFREKQTLNSRKTWSDPKLREHVSNKMKEHWEDNEDRHNILKNTQDKFWSDPNNRDKQSNMMKSLWSDQSYAESVSSNIRKSHKDPYVILKISEASKRYWTSDRRDAHSKLMSDHWNNIDFVNNQFKTVGRYKEVRLPSGKIIKVQGYEDIAIDNLLTNYSEDDLIIGTKSIHKEIGMIKYTQDEKIRKYFPDIYIKSENRIIEVKSPFTFKINEITNYLKKDACINMNLKFSFMIISPPKNGTSDIVSKNYGLDD